MKKKVNSIVVLAISFCFLLLSGCQPAEKRNHTKWECFLGSRNIILDLYPHRNYFNVKLVPTSDIQDDLVFFLGDGSFDYEIDGDTLIQMIDTGDSIFKQKWLVSYPQEDIMVWELQTFIYLTDTKHIYTYKFYLK